MPYSTKTIIRGAALPMLLAATLLLASCGSPETPESRVPDTPRVTMATAELAGDHATYRFSGTVTSQHTVQISTKVTGRVSHLQVEEGDYVREGEVLVRIKDDNLQAQKSQVQASLAEAESAFANLETNYRRIRNLYEKDSATQKELDDITAQHEQARARVDALQARLREIEDLLAYTVLKAPFNGYVVNKFISAGDLAGPVQPLLTLEGEESMEVTLSVPESRITHFSQGDTLAVTVPAATRQGISGVVNAINPSSRAGSRQFSVELSLPEASDRMGLKTGMFAEARLRMPSAGTVRVPESALVRRGQLSGLYTLNSDSEVVLRWVRLGDSVDGQVEILSGLSPGEAYVASYEAPLREGQKVNIQ